MIDIPTKPKAYSYLRFSTPEQQKGDSFRRQTQMAEDYASRKGLDLDDTFTFHDLGISAFRGDNLETGMLGYFLEAVRSGEVAAGSFLLVESLDRLSRQNARRALRTLEDIADRGITVVTLIDGREYSRDSLDKDPLDLFVSLLTFMRANEESATKARRLKEAWKGKRQKMADGVPLTAIVPAWLRLDQEAQAVVSIPERSAIVRRIFEETLAGTGQDSIAKRLNREGVKPWGRGKMWQRSYIAKILENPAVIGTYTPHTLEHIDGKRTRLPQEPVANYYPAAISEDLWNEAQALKAGVRSRSRGRHASAPVTNILAGLASCPICGSTMTRVHKGARSLPKYVCVRAKGGAGCTYRSVPVSLVEDAIVERLPERLRDAPAGQRDSELDREIETKRLELGALSDQIERLIDQAANAGGSAALGKAIRDRETEFEALRDTLADLEARQAAAAGQTVQARIAKVLATLEGEQRNAAEINQAMRFVFRKVTVEYRDGLLIFDWLHGGSMALPYALPTEGDEQ
ncbi:recombinase family protein [Sphingobium estronivorans]|uniref:recombinase family protein n=1 Tax=Sphingobium estronivorans TaxID=1577690 RepID=UPI001239BFE5|nr:recombinase family protein [Sphingobium estronivorans]